MPHFKAFDMINLQYEVGICQILYNKGTITNTSWYPFKCNRHYNSNCMVCIVLGVLKGPLYTIIHQTSISFPINIPPFDLNPRRSSKSANGGTHICEF